EWEHLRPGSARGRCRRQERREALRVRRQRASARARGGVRRDARQPPEGVERQHCGTATIARDIPTEVTVSTRVGAFLCGASRTVAASARDIQLRHHVAWLWASICG